MTRSERILLVGFPFVLVVAVLYPFIPFSDKVPCAVSYMLHLNCPGCGMIRSVVALVRGDFKTSVIFNPMGSVFFIISSVLWLRLIYYLVVSKSRSTISALCINIVSIAFVAGLFIQWFIYLTGELLKL